MYRKKILITGANGFIGQNLILRLSEQNDYEVLTFVNGDGPEKLEIAVAQSDIIIHLAGKNRSNNIDDFNNVNINLTETLCKFIENTKRDIPLIFASSVQAEHDNVYGQSKLGAEQVIEAFVYRTNNSTVIYRLPGIFGKFSKHNYNSVVATFCHNIARSLPITINNADFILELSYIDDLVDELLEASTCIKAGLVWGKVLPTHKITVKELAEQINAFKNCRSSLHLERVGTSLTRALYSTYISYLPPEKFVYDLPQYTDERGTFVEMLKTPDCGQFSFFTVSPGVTRGSHYHHSKTEKFLVVKGLARLRLRQLITNESHEVILSSDKPQVMDTIPGWAHDITNIGDSEAVVMLWANEVFDRQRPDCVPCKV